MFNICSFRAPPWSPVARGKGRGAGEKRQTVCKPGSVPASKAMPEGITRGAMDGHSSGTPVTERLARPTRTVGAETRLPRRTMARRPYSVLLPVGFTLPPTLPPARCALTAPFHPYPPMSRGATAGGLLSVALIPGVAPAGHYPAPCFRGARTFLSPIAREATVQPSDRARPKRLSNPRQARASI